jgi:hypothetical protein
MPKSDLRRLAAIWSVIYYEEPRGKYYIGYVTGPNAIDHRRGDYLIIQHKLRGPGMAAVYMGEALSNISYNMLDLIEMLQCQLGVVNVSDTGCALCGAGEALAPLKDQPTLVFCGSCTSKTILVCWEQL